MRIGILGGTFDPVHLGHLKIAEIAVQQIELSRVFFMPAGRPWLKARQNITPACHRKAMVEIAIAANPLFELSPLELKRRGNTYTVETLGVIRQTIGRNAELFFLLGWDSLLQLPQWKNPAEIIKMCHLVAFTRSRVVTPNLHEMEKKVPGIMSSTIMLDIPPIEISSSNIRARVAAGLSIKDMVPPGVEEYINTRHLYRQS